MDCWAWMLMIFTAPTLIRSLWRALKKKAFGKKIEDKVAVVTGASSGIGRAVAKELHRNGCRLVLCSRDVQGLENLKKELLTTAGTGQILRSPTVLKVDLSDETSIDKFVADVFEVYPDGPDILVNSAGISHRSYVADMNMEVHKKVMQVDYFGPVQLITKFLPKMIRKDDGHIVNVSSLQGLFSLPQRSAYCAAKHAIQSFSDSLRIEMLSKGQNIKVTVVSPGYVSTNLSLSALTGNGNTYGVMDENTKKGFKPECVAEEIVAGLCLDEDEVIVAKWLPSSFIYVRRLLPSFYFKIMAIRDCLGNGFNPSRILGIILPISVKQKTTKRD